MLEPKQLREFEKFVEKHEEIIRKTYELNEQNNEETTWLVYNANNDTIFYGNEQFDFNKKEDINKLEIKIGENYQLALAEKE